MTMDSEAAYRSNVYSLVDTHLQLQRLMWLWLVHATKVCHFCCFTCIILSDSHLRLFTEFIHLKKSEFLLSHKQLWFSDRKL